MAAVFAAETRQDVLTDALKAIVSVIPSRVPVPILHGVRITAESGRLTLEGFDYVQAITEHIDGTGSGTVVVNARTLLDLVKDLEKGCPVTFKLDGSTLSVTGDGVTYKLLVLPEGEYPTLPRAGQEQVLWLSPAQVARLVDVTGAASRDSTLPILTGIYLQVSQGEVRAWATDRYRLAEYVINDPAVQPKTPFTLLVLHTTVLQVAKLFKGTDVLVTCEPGGEGTVTFSAGGRELTVQQIDGQYPKVGALFPTEFASRVTFTSADLQKAIRQVAKATERNCPVKLAFDAGGSDVTFSAKKGEDLGGSKVVTAQVDGTAITTAFNPSFADDAIKAVGSARIRIGFTVGAKPAIFSDPDDSNFRVLLMPVWLPAGG